MIDAILEALGVAPDAELRREAVRGFFGLLGAALPFLFGFLAWLGSRTFERSRERRGRETRAAEETRRRAMRRLDLLVALHAEILAGGHAAELQDAPAERRYALANETPFGPADRTDFVFAAVRQDISVLPEATIYEIVRYYRLAEQTNLMTEALLHPLFREQSREERDKFLRQMLDLLREQGDAARAALRAIEAHVASEHGEDLAARLRSRRSG